MARKPQHSLPPELPTSTPDVAATAREVATLESTWTPTRDQRRAKAKLTVALRDDPLLVSTSLTGPTAASITGVSGVETWWLDRKFRSWFLDNYEAAAKAEFLFDQWLEEVAHRLSGMADKDLLVAGKLLAELARKMPDKFQKEKILDAGIASLQGDGLREFIRTNAAAIGLRLVDDANEGETK